MVILDKKALFVTFVIVRNAYPYKQASESIHRYAAKISEADRRKFIEVVENELLSLHDGNFARYYISPSEFNRWKETWKAGNR